MKFFEQLEKELMAGGEKTRGACAWQSIANAMSGEKTPEYTIHPHDDDGVNRASVVLWLRRAARAGAYCSPLFGRNYGEELAMKIERYEVAGTPDQRHCRDMEPRYMFDHAWG